MKKVMLIIFMSIFIIACQKEDDSEQLFNKAEGFLKLNMYREALDIYIELKSREYKTEVVSERIKFVSSKLAEAKLKSEVKSTQVSPQIQDGQGKAPSSVTTSEFKVSKCDNNYNERIESVKNEMKPYQDELAEIEKKLAKITSEYKVVQKDGVYNIAVPADTPKEKQKEIAEGPAREFGTLNARKNEILQKMNKFNEDISKIIDESRKAGQPSECIKR
ncbi:MAG: hypothetical protein N3B13_03480 [Deltaproteobacteria bacterium]|nr:hypothetical protein [Deltaproteobacteria bacterium]